ncbi:hypothetical protein D3C73_989830 [compost metagenome]
MKFEKRQDEIYLWTRSDAAYEGAILDRHLLLTDGYFLDWFHVELEEEAQIDSWFHVVGKLSDASNPVSDIVIDSHDKSEGAESNPAAQSGYEFIQLLRRSTSQSDYGSPVSWTSAVMAPGLEVEAGLVSLSTWLSSTMAAYEIQTPGVSLDPSIECGGLCLRERGRIADFITVYRDGAQPVILSDPHCEDSIQQISLTTESGLRTIRLHSDHGLA